ncbi:hypothetical protein NQ317_016939 [Molorchus minor]|uniref:Uncharacterized protein n=1 Tax=Molorchus minor TaxID=1323400 RepID=A0ABQ9K5Z5_9CUCU|nr:hypothetical protein NQ317_016939 [Molorchus minor]
MEPEVNNSEKEPEINVCDIKDEQKDWQTKKEQKKVETQSESCLVKNEEPKTVILDVKDVKIEQAKPLVIQKEEPVPQTAKITTTTNQIKPQNAKEQDHNVRPQKTFKHETHPLQQETTPPPLSPAVNRTESTTSSTLNSIKTASDPLKAAPSTTKNKQIIDALPPSS